MKNFSKILITFLFGVIFLFAGKTAMAYDFPDQANTTYTGYFQGTTQKTAWTQSFIPTEAEFTQFALYMCKTEDYTSSGWGCVADADDTPDGGCLGGYTTYTSATLNATIPDCATPNWAYFELTEATTTLTVSQTYWIKLNTGSTSDHTRVYYDDTNPYANGFATWWNTVMVEKTEYAGADLTFATYYYSSTPPPIGDDQIQFNFPNTEGPVVVDFENFILEYNLHTSTVGSICLEYFDVDNAVGNYAWSCMDVDNAGNNTDIYFPKDTPLEFNHDYSANVWLYDKLRSNPDWNKDNYIDSDNINFSLLEETWLQNIQTPSSTVALTDAYITCDETSGLFASSICFVAKYLFEPSQLAISKFATLRDDLENKPPFGYFTLISDELDNINGSSTPAFSLPDMTGLSGILDPLRTGLAIILWLAFVLYLYWRVKHLDL